MCDLFGLADCPVLSQTLLSTSTVVLVMLEINVNNVSQEKKLIAFKVGFLSFCKKVM